MGTKSRESIYGNSVRHSAERAAEARKEADRLACVAWNQRMLGFKGPAQPSPALGDALNAGYLYLEVRCLGSAASIAMMASASLRTCASGHKRRSGYAIIPRSRSVHQSNGSRLRHKLRRDE
jgi:hypothetical protein